MKERFVVTWRIAIALVLLFALVPAVALAVPAQAASPPDTYMDELPQYVRTGGCPVLTGTSVAAPTKVINQVQLQIRWTWPVADGGDGVTRYWDGDGAVDWTAVETFFYADVAPAQVSGWMDQWEWADTANLPAAGDLTDGQTYTVYAWAYDDDSEPDPSPSVRSFISDKTAPPDPIITTIGDASAPGWIASQVSTIAGTAQDTAPGMVDTVQLRITRDPGGGTPISGDCWDGTTWMGGTPWIWAAGTTSWQMTTSTYPPLPTDWKHGWVYRVETRCYDKSGRLSPTATQQDFTFQNNWTGFSCHIDPIARDDGFPHITGNAIAGTGRTISDVEMRIFNHDTGKYWDGAASWVAAPDTWFSVNPADGGFNAQDENWDTFAVCTLPGGVDGTRYSVWARALDDAGPPNIDQSTEHQFVCDNTNPGESVINPFHEDTILLQTVFDSLTVITGYSTDTTAKVEPGALDSVDVQIWEDQNDNQVYDGTDRCWTGREWRATASANWLNIPWTGTPGATGNWRWDTGDTPPLPDYFIHNMDYYMVLRAVDEANNKETTAEADFIFIVDLAGGYVPVLPTSTTPPGPTATGGPTTPPVTAPTATYTSVPPVQPTYTTVATTPPQPTPTSTAAPGFSGSGSVGSSGGTVTAKDGDNNTRVKATFSANAFSSSTPVTIEGTGTCTGSPPDGYVFGNSCFEITPSQDLGAKATICVYYTSADESAGGGDADNLKLAYKDSGTWHVLGTTVDKTAGTVCAETTHLSSWAVVGKEVAEAEWEWWHYLLIGLGALAIIVVVILIFVLPKGEGGEGEYGEYGEEEIYGEEEEL